MGLVAASNDVFIVICLFSEFYPRLLMISVKKKFAPATQDDQIIEAHLPWSESTNHTSSCELVMRPKLLPRVRLALKPVGVRG